MSKIIPITPTCLSKWHTCPRVFRASYITKETPYTDSHEARFGVFVHEAIEAYLKHGTPLPEQLEFFAPVVNQVKNFKGDVYVEAEVAINKQMQAVAWRQRWQGGKADVILVDKASSRAVVIDWKTGKGKDAYTRERFGDDASLIQSRILALCTAITYQVNEVITCFVYPFKPVVQAVIEYYHPADNREFGEHYMMCQEFEQAQIRGAYPPKKNGLCKAWCAVRTCEHNGRIPEEVRTYLTTATGDVPIEKLIEVFGDFALN